MDITTFRSVVLLVLASLCFSLEGQVRLFQIEPADTLNTGDSVATYEKYFVWTQLDTTGVDDYRLVYEDTLLTFIFGDDSTVIKKIQDTIWIPDSLYSVIDTVGDTYIDSLRLSADTLWGYRVDAGGTIVDSVNVILVSDSLITLDPWKIVFTDQNGNLQNYNTAWSDSITLWNGTVRYGLLDDDNNVSWGNNAGFSNTTGIKNVNIGFTAGYSNTLGQRNTYINDRAGYLNIGNDNVAVGALAGYGTSSANYDYSVFIGYLAGRYNLTGDYNIGIGRQALEDNQTGIGNVAIGKYAGQDITGSYNLAYGDESLRVLVTGNYNTAFGGSSLRFLTGGTYNIGVGQLAGYGSGSPSADGNVFIGALSGYTNYGDYNIGIGRNALYNSDENSDFNIAIGRDAGYNIIGDYNIFIGYDAGETLDTVSNLLIIDNSNSAEPIVFGDMSADSLRFNSTVTIRDIPEYSADSVLVPGSDHEVSKMAVSDLVTDSLSFGLDPWKLVFTDQDGHLQNYNTAWSDSVTFWNGTTRYGLIDSSGNIIWGRTAGNDLTETGVDNVLLGNQAGFSITTGTQNVALGKQALFGNSGDITGDNNMAIGTSTSYNTTSGSGNAFVGVSSGFYHNSGDYNTGIGFEALKGKSTGITGQGNTGVSFRAGYSTSSAAFSTHIGYEAGFWNETGQQQVNIGFRAGYQNKANFNTAIGPEALGRGSAGVTGQNNVGIGRTVLYSLTSGASNTGIGYNAGRLNETGNYNVFIGYETGYSALGSNNIFIGKSAGYNETGSDKLYIDNSNSAEPIVFGDMAADSLRFNSTVTVRDIPEYSADSVLVPGSDHEVSKMAVSDLVTDSLSFGLDPWKLVFTDENGNLQNYNTAWSDSVTFWNGTTRYGLLDDDGNILWGQESGNALVSNLHNVMSGYRTGYNIGAEADYNVISGFETGVSVTGDYNVLAGYRAGYNGGNRNIYMGTQAGYTNANDYNIFLGDDAGRFSTGTDMSIYIGRDAGYRMNGDYNIGIGYLALESATGSTGNSNLAIGRFAGRQLEDGSNNILVGYQAGGNIIDADYNQFFGLNTGLGNVTGQYNVMFGNNTGEFMGNASYVVAAGHEAAAYVDTNYVIAFGTQAGYNGMGVRSIGIGYQAGYSETGADMLYISNDNSDSPIIKGYMAIDSLIFHSTVTVRDLSYYAADSVIVQGSDNELALMAIADVGGVDDDWYIIETTDAPTDINDNIYTQGKARVGMDSLETVATFGVNGGLNPFTTWSSTTQNLHRQQTRANGYFVDYNLQVGEYEISIGNLDSVPAVDGNYLKFYGGYYGDSTIFNIHADGDANFHNRLGVGVKPDTATAVHIYDTDGVKAELRIQHIDSSYSKIIDTDSSLFIEKQVKDNFASTIHLTPVLHPDDTLSDARVGLFRNTKTSGEVSLDIFEADSTSNIVHRIANTTNSYLYGDDAYTGLYFGLGTSSPQAKLHIYDSDEPAAMILNTNQYSISRWIGISAEAGNPHIYWKSGQDLEIGTSATEAMGSFAQKASLTSAGQWTWDIYPSSFTDNTAKNLIGITAAGVVVKLDTADFRSDDDFTRNNNHLYPVNTIDSVGIGLTSVGAKLHVDGSVQLDGLSAAAPDTVLGYNTSNQLVKTAVSDLGGGSLWTNNSGLHYPTVLTDTLFKIRNTNGNTTIDDATEYGRLNINVPSGTVGISLVTSVGNSHFPWSDGNNYFSGVNTIFRNSSNTEYVRFDGSEQEVGIGTTDPAYKLHVNGTAYGASVRALSLNGFYLTASAGGGQDFNIFHSTHTYFDANTGDNIIFRESSTARLTIDNSSNEVVSNSPFELESTLIDINNSAGASTDILTSTGAGVDWVAASTVQSSWNLQANGGASEEIADGETVNFVQGGATTVSRTGNSITISSTDNDTQLSNEQVQDIVGNMVTGNTETGITVTYQDGDGTLDFVVSGAGGIYGGSGIIPAATKASTTSSFEIEMATSDAFYVDYNADAADVNELAIISSGTWLRGAGTTSVKLGSEDQNADELEIFSNSDKVTLRHEAATGSYLIFGDAGAVTLAATDASDNLTLQSATGEINLDGDTYIGDDLADQLAVVTTTSEVTIGHEAELNSGISFEEDGDILIEAENGTGDDVTIRADDQVIININGTDLFYADNNGSNIVYTPTGVRLGGGRVPTNYGIECGTTDASKGSAGDWVSTSDRRMKKNIVQLDGSEVLNRLLKIKGVTFEWNEKSKTIGYQRPNGVQYGLIAQDIIKGFDSPQFVKKDLHGFYEASYGTYDAIYIESFRYLKEENETLKEEVKHLERKIDFLTERFLQLEKQIKDD